MTEMCSYWVWNDGLSHRCANYANTGDYCGIHSPARKAERAKRRALVRRKHLTDQIKALQDALRPFAEAADSDGKRRFTHADLLRAKEVLGDD